MKAVKLWNQASTLEGWKVPRHAPSSLSTWGLSMTLTPLACNSEMASMTAWSVGVLLESAAIVVALALAWYQVASTPAQLALVAASAVRESVPWPVGCPKLLYSSKKNETWVIPL